MLLQPLGHLSALESTACEQSKLGWRHLVDATERHVPVHSQILLDYRGDRSRIVSLPALNRQAHARPLPDRTAAPCSITVGPLAKRRDIRGTECSWAVSPVSSIVAARIAAC